MAMHGLLLGSKLIPTIEQLPYLTYSFVQPLNMEYPTMSEATMGLRTCWSPIIWRMLAVLAAISGVGMSRPSCLFIALSFSHSKQQRSVHNTRIERLWVEVTRDFGSKWKDFFYELEAECGLDPDVPGHIWLLHRLFLDAINEDAHQWAAMWNEHKLQIKGGRRRSPREIFFTSLLQDGPRGLQSNATSHIDPEQGSPTGRLGPDNPFIAGPPNFSQVDVEVPGCPLNSDELWRLDNWLQAQADGGIRCMAYWKSLWIDALDFCSRLRDNDSA